METPELLIDGSADASAIVILTHGAGAPMDSPFMADVAAGVAARGLRAVRFEFPYMAARRQGGRPGPNPAKVLIACWRAVIDDLVDDLGRTRLVIGGKSLGGRIASMVADEASVSGLVYLGYPFHPPGRPEKQRTEHLSRLKTPTLILQGTRDSFGTPEDVAGYALSPAIRLHWLEDGDHSFKPRKASGRTLEQNIEEAIAAVANFAHGLV